MSYKMYIPRLFYTTLRERCVQILCRTFMHESKNFITQFYRAPIPFAKYQRHRHTSNDHVTTIFYQYRHIIRATYGLYSGLYSTLQCFYLLKSYILLLRKQPVLFLIYYKQTWLPFKKFQRSNLEHTPKSHSVLNSKARLLPREGIIYEWQRRCTVHVSSHEELQIFLPQARTIIKPILRREYFPRRLLTFPFNFPRIIVNFFESAKPIPMTRFVWMLSFSVFEIFFLP